MITDASIQTASLPAVVEPEPCECGHDRFFHHLVEPSGWDTFRQEQCALCGCVEFTPAD